MTSPHQEYRNLLTLTQSFILSEYKSRQKIFSDPSTYEFFKQYQPKQKLQQKQVITHQQQPLASPPTQRPPHVESIPQKRISTTTTYYHRKI